MAEKRFNIYINGKNNKNINIFVYDLFYFTLIESVAGNAVFVITIRNNFKGNKIKAK